MSVYIKQQFIKAGITVTPSQLGILFILKKRDRQTMSDISNELGTDNSAVTRLVDRLENCGFAKRNYSENDRRECHITITENGITETENALKVIAAINRKIGAEFSEEELDDFKKTLIKMNSLFMK